MDSLYLEKTKELKRSLKQLEKELEVKINLKGKQATIEGTPIKEYEALTVLEAISFGFSADTALLLKSEEITFRIINIKESSRRKNTKDIRSRLIGTHGQTRKTIEEISGCRIIINESEVGIIGDAEEVEYAITAITRIIKGSKQSNVYKYLERIKTKNKDRKR